MKNLIRIPLAVALSCCFCSTTLAQEFYRGEMFVTGQHFSLDGNHLNVELSVDFEGLKMPADESLTVIPILKSGDNEQELPAVLINGAEKQKVYQRELAFNKLKDEKGKKTGKSPIPAVVIRDNSAMARAFHYKVAVPYSEWMRGAVLLLRSQECACHGSKGASYEDKIANGLDLPRPKTSPWDSQTNARFLALVNFIAPAAEVDSVCEVKGSIPYYDYTRGDRKAEQKAIRKNGYGKPLGDLSEEKQNFEFYYRLRDAIRDIRQERGTELTKVKLTGYGAPIGNLRKNEKNALARALALKEYLRENRLTGTAPLEVTWIPEDWDSIATLVKESDMMLREASLDLITNVDVSKGRERMLMELADGAPYKYMAEKIFPQVKRLDYEIIYSRKPLDTTESMRLFQTNQRALRLSEFFAVAKSYPAGSKEYNDALDLAARIFPDSPEANINAAAVALTKGDTKRARHYLERFATLPIAYNNMGILYLLEGNRDKAEVYLQMAAANGIKEAEEALRELKTNINH